jgi:hypothetical protein
MARALQNSSPSAYDLDTSEGYRLTVIVQPATVRWSFAAARLQEESRPQFTECMTVRSRELIDGRYVLNDSHQEVPGSDRDWAWAAEQIRRGAPNDRPHVTEPPGKTAARASNGTSKWTWCFLDILDLQEGGISWAPFETEMPFYQRAKGIVGQARQWVDDAHPEWRDESIRLGIVAAIRGEREGIVSKQTEIRAARDKIAEMRRHISDLQALSSDTGQ